MQAQPLASIEASLEHTDDSDRQETSEWLDALAGVARHGGADRVGFLMRRLAEHAPIDAAQHADILRGMRRHATMGNGTPQVRLLGSGAILREVIAAAEVLAQEWGIAAEVWSVTSFSELARDAQAAQRERLFASGVADEARSHLETCLAGSAPVVAATDYVRAYANLIAPYVDAPYTALGTDGFGRSDTRPALRRFFEVDRRHVVLAALAAVDPDKHRAALARDGATDLPPAPWQC
ncbi:hypothetical protein MNJPNG_08730 [Cupriavidus oxalaticus]|uniref:transketolase-like TK C-terminal-containing protein n=1 Tax=Cupriavidus oxalaticus TaxID=96344 RepID=UPI003F73401E